MSRENVRAYYARCGEREWTRLTNPVDGAVEFAVNCHAIMTHLPANARVLDIGGGPGRYTIWLAQRGHRVVLADLSPELLAVAREKVTEANVTGLVDEIVEADACNLSHWGDNSFDAVLSLGPFYHLPDPIDRERAAREMVRVLRPGGKAFVALMPRYALLRRTLIMPEERHHLANPDWVARLLDDGVFVNDAPGRFNTGYGVQLEEVAPFFEKHGFAKLDLLASEGVASGVQDALAQLAASDPASYQVALDIIVRTASDPSILGMCGHLLYIGAKL